MTGRNMVFSNRSNPGSERLTTGPALKGQHTWGLTCHQIISYQCKTHYFLSICKKICSYSINIYIYIWDENHILQINPGKQRFLTFTRSSQSPTYLVTSYLPRPERNKTSSKRSFRMTSVKLPAAHNEPFRMGSSMVHPWTHASCHVIDISSNKSCKTKLIRYVLHKTGMPLPHFLSNPFVNTTIILSCPTALMIRHASRHKGLNQLLQKLGTYMTGNDMIWTSSPSSL